VPGPVYEVVPDWKKNFKGKGKFSVSPRVTFTQNILHTGKIKPCPGPGQYENKNLTIDKIAKEAS